MDLVPSNNLVRLMAKGVEVYSSKDDISEKKSESDFKLEARRSLQVSAKNNL